jgi:endoglucanase
MRRLLFLCFCLLGMAVGVQGMESSVNQTEDSARGFVSVNQLGYLPDGVKIAVYPTADAVDHLVEWYVLDATGQIVATGEVESDAGFHDQASGDYVYQIDFSQSVPPDGTYTLKVGDTTSVPFQIGAGIYQPLVRDALRYFYLNRSGIALDPQYAGEWARPAGHLSDSSVTCYRGSGAGQFFPGCDYRIDASGGWYDAGDYGKYVVNGGISVWTLVNMYEFNPAAFADGALGIPESGNGVPDVLDEARWEMDWLLKMQVPEGQEQAGMAYHKLHALAWDGMVVKPPAQTAAGAERFLMPPSTAATLNLAAAAAQCARVWRDIDAEFAASCLAAAERAWRAAKENPVFLYGSIPGNGGGNYDDNSVEDEWFWAAVELYTTTGDQSYHDALIASPYFAGRFNPGQESAIWWGDVGVLGSITLALHPSRIRDDQDIARDLLISVADHYVEVTAREGYRMAMPPTGYSWGSNSNLLNNALVMAYAYRFTDEAKYLDAVVESMDYVLGRNALNFSFVSGYGTNAMAHPHHRFWADREQIGYPPVPPGTLAGGPNAHPADPDAQDPAVAGRTTSKRYIDVMGSYSTNEVAINWNAPLAWVVAFLDQTYGV